MTDKFFKIIFILTALIFITIIPAFSLGGYSLTIHTEISELQEAKSPIFIDNKILFTYSAGNKFIRRVAIAFETDNYKNVYPLARNEYNIFFITDIVAGAGRTDIDNPEVLKIAVLLQSMDSDGDPTNGIDVPPEAAAIIDALPGTTTSIADLSAEQVVVLTTATVVELQVTYPAVTYVPVAEAESNLADSAVDIANGTTTPPSQLPTGSEGGS